MISTFNKDEKKLLVAILKLIATADHDLVEGELEVFGQVAGEKGFDDFQAVFDETDRTVKSLNDLSRLVKNVEDSEHKMDILRFAVLMARADGNMRSGETDVIRYLSRVWNIDEKTLTDQF